MSANLYELLSKPFQEFSDSVAIECHERGIWTYGELEEQTARYADWLIGSGVKPGDRVVVQAEKSPEVVFLYLASLKSGAIFYLDITVTAIRWECCNSTSNSS